MSRNPQSSPTLSYARPRRATQESGKDALLAAILAAPGVAGFSLVGGALLFRSKLAWAISPKAGLCIWVVAFICAITSILLFQRKPQPWWVMLCILINMTGVILTLSPFGWVVAALLWLDLRGY